jgi:L-rhamnose-H+ transport protein
MEVLIAIVFTLIAGSINGSYALPTKKLTAWRFENTWMVFAIYTFLITPWLFLLIVAPNAWQVYQHASGHLLRILLVGGFVFGIGQIGFAFALERIGMGLAFVINISLSVVLGSLLPFFLLHQHHDFHIGSILNFIGIAVIIFGVLSSYFAGKRREQVASKDDDNSVRYIIGVLAAVLAGLGSAGQNFSFAATASMQTMGLQLGLSKLASSFIIWPGFLTAAFIPYALYMLVLNVKNKSFSVYQTGERKYYLYAVYMAVCWFGSLVFYSKASQLIGRLGPVIAWPLFMSLIILTSNFWGWRFGEWLNMDARSKTLMKRGIALFLISVVLFAAAAAYTNHVRL